MDVFRLHEDVVKAQVDTMLIYKQMKSQELDLGECKEHRPDCGGLNVDVERHVILEEKGVPWRDRVYCDSLKSAGYAIDNVALRLGHEDSGEDG